MSLQDTPTDTSVAEKPAAADPATAAATPAPSAEKPAETGKPATAPPAATGEKPATKAAATSSSIFEDDDEDGEAAAATAGDVPAKAEDATGEAEAPTGGEKWVPPDDWRERIAAGDAKHLAELKRFSSWDNWLKSQRTLRAKLSSGEYKAAATWDDNWSDEQKSEWRKANNVPEKPDQYTLPEVKTHQWSDADRAAFAPLLERLHAKNASSAVVADVASYYAELLENANVHRVNADREHKIGVEDELRQEWGPDYRANLNLIKRVIDDGEILPGGMKEGGVGAAIMDARLSDGRKLINVPGMVSFLASLARQSYGETALLPSSEVASIESREAEITRIMREDINRYYREKNSKGQTLEQELAELRARKAGKSRAA